jgi:hypothetical protein
MTFVAWQWKKRKMKLDNKFFERFFPKSTDSVDELRNILAVARQTIGHQQELMIRLSAEPLLYATILSVSNKIDPKNFAIGGWVLVTDKESPFFHRIGQIVKAVDGEVTVDFYGAEKTHNFKIGIKSESQIKLLFKNDGRFAVVTYGNRIFEVWGNVTEQVKPGYIAKLNKHTLQIVDIIPPTCMGEVAKVIKRLDNRHVLLDLGHKYRAVICEFVVKKGDEVLIDPSHSVVTKICGRMKTARKTR